MNLIEILTNIVNAISSGLDWYLSTPLLNDTLDAIYVVGVFATWYFVPLIGEHIAYLSEYFQEVSMYE